MNRTLEFKVSGMVYKIDFPTVGKFQSIEANKQVISKGMYGSLLNTATVASYQALNMIDLEAHLSVLAPLLMEDLKCKSFGDLDIEDYLELEKAYKSQFLPWWNDIMKLFVVEQK